MISILINSLAGGGAERVALTLLKELHQDGVEVELVCLEREQFFRDVPAGIAVTHLTGFDALKNPVVKLISLVFCAYRLKRHVKRNRVACVQSHLIRANYVNTLARIMGSPHRSQIVNHMMVSFDKKRGFLGRVTRLLYPPLYSRADVIVSITEAMRRDLDGLLRNHRHHVVIPNPHDIRTIAERAEAVIESFEFDPDKKYIVSAGRLVERKRMDLLINAYAQIRGRVEDDVELLILGDGKMMQSHRDEASRLAIDDFVHFLGRVDNPYPFIRRSEVLVLASDDEGLPNIIIESLACGTPVISSDCKSGPREILAPDTDVEFQLKRGIEVADYGLLFAVGRSADLAEALELVLGDAELRERLSRRGLKRARDFCADKIAAKYIEALGSGAL